MNDMESMTTSKSMSYDIRDYVKVYENVFSKDFCKHIAEGLSNEAWVKHSYYDSENNKPIYFDHEPDISFANPDGKKILQERLWSLIEDYIIKEHAHFSEWFNSWSGYSEIRFNRYKENEVMLMHWDRIQSMFDGVRKGIPTLSIVGSLNDDYEGGEFMMWGGQKIDLPAGSVVIFPSNFLYAHQVLPVKSGARISFVSWVW